MSTLELAGVSKAYGSTIAVDGIDLRIENNEFFCIFGPPSSGKSTILRLLLGLAQPDSGRVLIGGKDVTDTPPASRDLAMVFQNLALFPHLTARQNMEFPLRERHAPQAVRAATAFHPGRQDRRDRAQGRSASEAQDAGARPRRARAPVRRGPWPGPAT